MDRLIYANEAASFIIRMIILNGDVNGNVAMNFDSVEVGSSSTNRMPEKALTINKIEIGIVVPLSSSGRLTIEPNTAYREAYNRYPSKKKIKKYTQCSTVRAERFNSKFPRLCAGSTIPDFKYSATDPKKAANCTRLASAMPKIFPKIIASGFTLVTITSMT